MTETEKAYIAGIIDGEGSIMLQKFHSNQFPSPCISIASTTYELLEWIQQVTGKGTIKAIKNRNPEKFKNSYSYILRYNDAINLLIEISPYLIINSKRKRAELIINKYKTLTPRNGRYTMELINLKNEFYEEFISLK